MPSGICFPLSRIVYLRASRPNATPGASGSVAMGAAPGGVSSSRIAPRGRRASVTLMIDATRGLGHLARASRPSSGRAPRRCGGLVAKAEDRQVGGTARPRSVAA